MVLSQNQAPIMEQERMNLVGPQVRKYRQKQGFTQDDLVARCNLLEWNISRSTLAKIESKVRRVTDKEVALLAKALKINVSELYKKLK